LDEVVGASEERQTDYDFSETALVMALECAALPCGFPFHLVSQDDPVRLLQLARDLSHDLRVPSFELKGELKPAQPAQSGFGVQAVQGRADVEIQVAEDG
jgi:hypothetical protein